MKITLNKVLPTPLASIAHSEKSIWGSFIELKDGQRIMLNASSGKGKSTFTTTTIGLRNDYSGEILYDNQNIAEYSPNEWAEIRQSKVAVVFQDLQLFPKFTVKENLLIKNQLTNVYSEMEIIQMMEELEIGDKWTQECGLLSMGQQQRVAIIRALIQPYSWLIMDEPFSHLDIENTERCLNMIHNRTIEQKAGFVLTTLGENHGYTFDNELNL
jgi:ABC-type lipoprotein export system ATPase subunit